MGYRSQYAIVFPSQHDQKVRTWSLTESTEWNDFTSSYDDRQVGEQDTLYCWEYAKICEEMETELYAFLNHESIPFYSVRIGESSGDEEYNGDYIGNEMELSIKHELIYNRI